jgi:murein DD-endopeptidase MepM/ murein hydrolase activator NlpD
LTSYNDKLIEDMYKMIEENKQLQIDLDNKKKELGVLVESLNSKLKSLNVELSDIAEIQLDLAAQIKAQEEAIKYYKDLGCNLNEDLSKCVKIPFASGFTRPLVKGKITSNFGYREHPTKGTTLFHNAVDIGGNSEGTAVYASAAGVVAAKVVKSDCGGNGLYIHHTVTGVNYTTQYLHLLRFNVNVGDVVTENTIIGYVGGGSTATKNGGYDKCTTGAHLHFGIGKGWYMGNGYTSYSKWIDNCVDPKDYVYLPNSWSTRYY